MHEKYGGGYHQYLAPADPPNDRQCGQEAAGDKIELVERPPLFTRLDADTPFRERFGMIPCHAPEAEQ